MNDHPSRACGTDRIRLIAIETMKGAFGNEGALRFLSDGRTQSGFFAQERQNFINQRVGSDAVLFAQNWNGAVLDKIIWPADPDHGRVNHLRV